ncbi:MAG: C40 family peptidase [Magnetococcales bacterium]|nr:C40 family peptidase [Magnetococcales bacterium]
MYDSPAMDQLRSQYHTKQFLDWAKAAEEQGQHREAALLREMAKRGGGEDKSGLLQFDPNEREESRIDAFHQFYEYDKYKGHPPLTEKEIQRIIDVASEWAKGTFRYQSIGMATKKGVGGDCSGAIFRIFNEAGFPMDFSRAGEIGTNPHFKQVPEKDKRPGDIVQLKQLDPNATSPWHVGIYDPNAKPEKRHDMWHASVGANAYISAAVSSVKGFKVTGYFRYYK